ncbi:MAG: flagellar hook-basal body complex protein [Epsilonproteobacteria bacterium]|nr:flagellar hook-basal body complex protein [Campylobacterota bacterium]
MNSSFFNGVSGIKTQQFGIDVWADNITGVNTPGYKASTPEFSTIFTQQLSNSYLNPTFSDKGLGSRAQATAVDFQQGNTVSTESVYDLAINGSGWFGVVDPTGDKYYTRAGAFNRDAAGFLVDAEGNYVTGTSANNFTNGVVIENPNTSIAFSAPSEQTKIEIPDQLTIPPAATTEVKFSGSLNSEINTAFSAETGQQEEVANVEVYRSSIFDAEGNENPLRITLTKVVPQGNAGTVWNAKAVLTDNESNPISEQEGQISFNERGAIIANTLTSIDNNGVQTALNFGSFYNANEPNSGFDGLVSLNGFESERITTKDGHAKGDVLEYGIDSEGTIIASFDNGQTLPISKVAIYNFQNEKGLQAANPVYFTESANSGQATFYSDAEGNYFQNATISSNKLEMSNINLSTALTELLVMQKAFDASARSITTSDELIQNAINMKQ